MKILAAATLVLVLLCNTLLPCGPGYITPLFDTTAAPENPYTDFAAGRLGIVKPKFHRSVLIAAYRYIAGRGMTGPEQEAIVQVWKAEIDNKDFADDSIDEAVNTWVETRKKAELKEEKPPEIYTARSYGGYDFFPNCTKNAFETASETLSDRLGSHGPNDPNLVNWVKGQDAVFENCASGKHSPDDVPVGAPDWLQKDRAYQKAAAEFYSLDYEAAKRDFAQIAQDFESPWRETADYLVARTLIRQASLAKEKTKCAELYDEAEAHLQRFVSASGKFTLSAEKMMGLIAYRRHPRERVGELAKRISYTNGNENFRQDVIDYCWLLDKFESDILTAEEKRKADEEAKKIPANTNAVPTMNAANYAASLANAAANTATASANSNSSYQRVTGNKKNEDDLELNLYIDRGTFTFFVRPDATDDQAIAEAEKVVGQPLTDSQKAQVRATRQSVYAGRFSADRAADYEGGYWGEQKLSPGLIADFLRREDLTDWLFAYQMAPSAEAYLYALNKFKASTSELWLMTAISKADRTSTDLTRILEAAANTSRTSAAYPTIAYNRTRILLDQGKTAEAKKIIDETLELGDQLPISARNSFLALKVRFATGLEDYLTSSLRRPYAFDFDGEVGSVDELIADAKKYYDPEVNKDGREAFDKEVENNYKLERLWQERAMFDDHTIETFNQLFPTQQLAEVERSPALPDYLRERFVTAIWMRSFLLDDLATLLKFTPELIKYHPEMEDDLKPLSAARTLTAQDQAILYFVLKHPVLTPYLESGLGRESDEQGEFDSDDWWCAPYDTEWNSATDSEQPKALPPRPAFLTAAQAKQAQTERKRLKDIGDAPKYLAEKVMDWAKKYPADRRVPEALYIVIQANGWTKYGCGNNEDIHTEYSAYLKKRYPSSPWTRKLLEDEKEQ